VLADIHGNIAALEAVVAAIDAWRPDIVAVAGDIVNRGPRPRECLNLILARARQDGWRVIRGNHERYVLQVAQDDAPQPGVGGDIRESVRWTLGQLGEIRSIAALPEQISLEGPGGDEIRIVHASMRHDRDNVLVGTPDAELREMVAPAPAVFCCGHTHRPLARRLDQTLVVNVGSAGAPFDGDTRACYAQITRGYGGWSAELARVEYDRERNLADLEASGMLAACGGTALIIRAELEDARAYMASWVSDYDALVAAGALSSAESALRHLAEARTRDHGR
jgi:predicted phosphodiesterase